uniref:Uncharacterized protein n=1 Tax=Kalanchoe fedtschenkoi TaxID=63787 RepID=A0A7N0UDH8_KALFE
MDHHLLAKLWDDTLAGPVPDLGLGNYSSSTRPASSSSRMRLGDVGKEGGGMGQQEAQRSIMTMRNNPMSESPPVSPAGSLSPSSEKVQPLSFYGN